MSKLEHHWQLVSITNRIGFEVATDMYMAQIISHYYCQHCMSIDSKEELIGGKTEEEINLEIEARKALIEPIVIMSDTKIGLIEDF